MTRLSAGVALLLLLSLMIGCKKTTSQANSGGGPSSPAGPPAASGATTGSSAAPATAATAAQPPAPAPSLVSLSAGAMVVRKPQEYSDGWAAYWMLDELPDTGWATPKGITGNQTIVIELPQVTLLKTLEFDTAQVDGENRAAKDVLVEMSNTSPDAGFQKIADLELANATDNQSFPVAAEAPGRWVRLTVKNNWGSPDYVEIMDFRGRGQQLTNTPFPDVSGTYQTNYDTMHIRQQGTSITGCYLHAHGLLEGDMDGRVMKVTWREDGPKDGPAFMVFSGDGKQFVGLWWYSEDVTGRGSVWTGTKVSNAVGSCPHWSGGAQEQIAQDLEQFGKARVYGINFDSDSDRIKDESRPTLDKIVALLKAKPDWKLTVEGHTDSTSTPQHNQALSEARARAVVAYLVNAGIDGSRLAAVGYGATRPVASDSSAIGRAQNRRVELVKQ